MTRINCISPAELTDKHLIAEYRELPRLRNAYPRKSPVNSPGKYCLGRGHVMFFLDKGLFLTKRHAMLVNEMKRRGFVVNYPTLDLSHWPHDTQNDWEPTEEAIVINRQRIEERLEKQ